MTPRAVCGKRLCRTPRLATVSPLALAPPPRTGGKDALAQARGDVAAVEAHGAGLAHHGAGRAGQRRAEALLLDHAELHGRAGGAREHAAAKAGQDHACAVERLGPALRHGLGHHARQRELQACGGVVGKKGDEGAV